MERKPIETPTTTHLATFRQPREHLNPLNLTMKAEFDIELYAVGKTPIRWQARIVAAGAKPRPITWPGSKQKMEYPESSGGVSQLKAAVRKLFDEQLTPWRAFTPGTI